jgi:hypothetical protein
LIKNIIDAISTLVTRNNFNLSNFHGGNNRINEVGYALEDYVKNLFADTFDCSQNDECYNKIRQQIKNGVEEISGVEFAPTRELGIVNNLPKKFDGEF